MRDAGKAALPPSPIMAPMSLSFFLTFTRLYTPHYVQSAVVDRLIMFTVCSQQILDHMDESGVYNESDLAPFHRRLSDLR